MSLNIHNSLFSRCLRFLHIIRNGQFHACRDLYSSRARLTPITTMVRNGTDNNSCTTFRLLWLGHFLLNQIIIRISLLVQQVTLGITFRNLWHRLSLS
ncbi:hypothetical protein M378DRAFT_168126 [Amanita muscaria Koide BX008]|uniref:Uncharacterized protein n=1 Tax=Amanita muscaria (strain Koide BX008) TaxID=946122 RepID=A0A0C2SBZ4_AMAMK|nr:hypothetical protein M378DRAFT_168126 [Amanita muscaria Koide BX008]